MLSLVLVAAAAHGAPAVVNSAKHAIDGSSCVVLRGQVALPVEGYWETTDTGLAERGVIQAYLTPPAKGREVLLGRRVGAIRREELINRGRYAVQRLYWACSQYAQKHGGVGPASVSDLTDKRYRYARQSVNRSPWANERDLKVEGPFVYLLPKVMFEFDGKTRRVPREKRRVLAVELRPYADDGKHWVAHTNGSCVRMPIDAKLVAEHKLTIRPVLTKQDSQTKMPSELAYTIVVLRKNTAAGPIPLTLRNVITEATMGVSWDPSGAATEGDAAMAALKEARVAAWRPYASRDGSPVLQTWLASYKQPIQNVTARRGRRGQSTSAFALMGGRAAVRETLQMQVLAAQRKPEDERTIPIGTLKGVQVKSHPYEEMLKGEKGGQLALANLAPHDRFFVHVAKPSSVVPFLDKGAEFLSRLGSTLTRSSIKYDLKTKYFARLGLTEDWVRAMLTTGVVTESALVFPDLFFLDGTDVTVISRLAQPRLIQTMLKLVGVADLAGQEMTALDLPSGRKVFWALRGDLLMISTSKSELSSVLTLHGSAGKGSLGQSAEFRYMLTQLPVEAATRAYVYFSDAFIRRLVGPRMKIAQLRRMQARAVMEYLTSCALLARLDGIEGATSAEELVARGYVSEESLLEDCTMSSDLMVYSDTYGTLADLATLSEVPAYEVTQAEADAYKRYVTNYSRYWRRFFDPIAVRLDDVPGGALEATTFILPIIDNTVYNVLRGSLAPPEGGASLRVPQLSPEPAMMLSVNLSDKAWQRALRDLVRELPRYTHLNPAALDDLGPALHLAIHDADPVIALGGGDILGAFGSNFARLGRSGMVFIPVALSVLTRPCSLIMETQNPARTRQYLRQAANAAFMREQRRRFMQISFYQIDDRDAWVLNFDIEGILQLRYGIELQDDLVVVRNIPWSSRDQVARMEPASLSAANLRVSPGACRLQLPGLHAAAASAARGAATNGLGHLYPLLTSGYATIDDAAAKHAKIFGFAPAHPGDGQWLWEKGRLASSTYGSVHNPRQPSYKDGDRDFGLMKELAYLNVSMQFEGSGLRTKVRWKLR